MIKVIIEFDPALIPLKRAMMIIRKAVKCSNRIDDPEWKFLILEYKNIGYSLWRERISEKIENIIIVRDGTDWPDRMKSAYENKL